MEKSHYQIHVDRIIGNTKIRLDYLLCCLCKNILWEPEKCKNCQTHFCLFCIKFSLLKSKICPSCQNEYNSSPYDHFLFEDLNELNVRCVYTYNGCNKILNYNAIINHENECIYKEKTCEECQAKILKKNYHTHIIICKNSLSDNLAIDYDQIVIYFHEKLEKIEKENLEDLEKLKKSFVESYNQKEIVLSNLMQKMEKNQKMLDELMNNNIKFQNLKEYEMKICSNNDNNFNGNNNRVDHCKII